jgi:hypothetical protein
MTVRQAQHKPLSRGGSGLRDPVAGDAPETSLSGVQAETGPVPRRATGLTRLLDMRFWPVAVVIALQAALTLRFIWSTTAFIDEGEYLSVGHIELEHLLHHAPLPDVAGYLSGAPIVYPPLAGIANDLGRLAGARLLSLAFMLLATVLLHGVTRRLLNRQSAFFAAVLFAGIGSTQFLGALATYDAMALALMALATWLAVMAVEGARPERQYPELRYELLILAGVTLAVADACKYAATLFDPAVIAVAALAAWQVAGRRAALQAGIGLTVVFGGALAAALWVAPASYTAGIESTTLSRAVGTDSVGAVLSLSAQATGVIAALAVAGAVVLTVRRSGWRIKLLGWTLAGAEFLAPAEQARIHTLTSLFKHVDYGAWFACVIAGYLLAEVASVKPSPEHARGVARAVRRAAPALVAVTSIAIVIGAGYWGDHVANGQYGNWPNSRVMTADLAKVAQPRGMYLVEDPSVVQYYLESTIPFENVDDTWTFYYTDPRTKKLLSGDPAFADAVKNSYFAAIDLAWGDTWNTDYLIKKDIGLYKTYRLVNTIPYRTSYGLSKYQIWVRVPAATLARERAAASARAARKRAKLAHHPGAS